MNDEVRVKALLAPFSAWPVDLDGQRFRVNRAKVTARILRAPVQIGAERVRRSRHQAIWAAAAAVAVVGSAGWLGLKKSPRATADALIVEAVRGSVTRFDSGAAIKVEADGRPGDISAASQLATGADSSARLRTEGGLQIEVFEKSRVALGGLRSPVSSSVRVASGGVLCRVPTLEPGRQFSVITPDAEVVVHGTVFSVQVSGVASTAHSCVRVEQGRVAVKSAGAESWLGPGQSWGCGEASASVGALPSTDADPGVTDSTAVLVVPTKRKERPAGAGATQGGTLDQENAIFQAGLSAERAGDPRAAEAAFERLLKRFPQSPLSEDAREALSRVKRGRELSP